MLTHHQKSQILQSIIVSSNGNYADAMKAELAIFFFENEHPLDFLKDLKTEQEIQNKVDAIIHQMIMHEDEASLQEIMELSV